MGIFLALPELFFKGSFQPKPFCDPNEAEFLADYLLSRAEAALESTDALESGHAQYVASMAGTWGLRLAALLGCCCNFIYPAAPGRFGAVSKHSLPVAGGRHRGWSWWVPMCLFEESSASWRGQRQPLQALLLTLGCLWGGDSALGWLSLTLFSCWQMLQRWWGLCLSSPT